MVKAVVVLRIRPNPSFTAKLELDLMRIGNSLPLPSGPEQRKVTQPPGSGKESGFDIGASAWLD
jgi:hypothetical protein